jgi:glyoxalase family protein
MVSDTPDSPQLADADDIPPEFRIRGIEGARSYTTLEELLPFADHLGFRTEGDHLVLSGDTRSARWYFTPAPARPFQALAPGVWHHIAFDVGDDMKGWQEYANAGPEPFTEVFDHYIFLSCYSVSPGGLVELCSHGPGFTVDQKLEDLGEGAVSLSAWTEPLRARLEKDLTPIDNPRSRKKAA